MAFVDRVIKPHFDKQFFERVRGVIEGVFASSDWRTQHEGRVLPAQFSYARGTDRYFALQLAVMTLALELGGSDATIRAGSFPIPLARHKRFLVGVCVTDSLKRLRGSKSRRMLASMNAALEPYQPDLFQKERRVRPADYFGMIVIAKRIDGDQRVPAGIYFGVPSSTLRSWHLYCSLDEMIQMYEQPARTENAVPKRLSRPTLRRVPRSGGRGARSKKNGKE